MGQVLLNKINKIYPNGVQAVYDFNLEINDGEFIVLVGPSGCGKSTTLRMIAGLEEISSGDLIIDDVRSNDVAPKNRNIAMVFQNYALYSHMTVYHNMAFSLVLRKVKSDIIHERVMWAAEILGLMPYLNRKPAQLSGGQRQRVALGRAIVRDPRIFLLDEPLSNLDAKLRGTMRKELKTLHHRLKKTMIYVTHDQIEALTLADRIVIMNEGYIMQVGTPYDIYHNPRNLFVAKFIGTPPMNTFTAVLSKDGQLLIDQIHIDIRNHKCYSILVEKGYLGKEVIVGVRPEHILTNNIEAGKALISEIDIFELYGSDALIHFKINDIKLIAKTNDVSNRHPKDKFAYFFDLNRIYFFDKETEMRIDE